MANRMGIFNAIKNFFTGGAKPAVSSQSVNSGVTANPAANTQSSNGFKYTGLSGVEKATSQNNITAAGNSVDQELSSQESAKLPLEDPALALLKAQELIKSEKERISSREVNVKTEDSGATAKLPQNPFKGV